MRDTDSEYQKTKTNEPHVFVSHEEMEFARLVEMWREATRYSSSATEITGHPDYLRIIDMGPRAVPLIIRELRQRLEHWFLALRILTETDPVMPEDVGNLEKMREAWLQWWDSHEQTVDQDNGQQIS